MKKITLTIKDMHCTSCSVLIDSVLEDIPGVKSAKTSYAQQRVEVEFDEALVKIEQMITTIKNEGYQAVIA